MVFSKVIDEIALFWRSFELSQPSAKVSAGFTNVSGSTVVFSNVDWNIEMVKIVKK